jgi:carboxyl-terminal processing protease
VQILEQFSDGSSAKITVAKWMTPSGKDINKEGIAPDIIVEMSLDDYKEGLDPQLEKALEILNSN